MLVQYKDPSVTNGYLPLERNKLYLVLAIAAGLRPGDSQSSALLYDPECKDSESGVAYPWFVDFAKLEIVDSTVPENWSSALLSEWINTPTLVFSFKEMLDRDFFIRVHDLNTKGDDDHILYQYMMRYGGNITLSKRENRMRSDEYLNAEAVVKKYSDELNEYYWSEREWDTLTYSYEDYCKSLRVAARTIIDRIALLESANSHRIFLEQLRDFTFSVGGRHQTGKPEDYLDLLELKKDLKYPYDAAEIVKKISAKKYAIQQKQFQVHKSKPK